MRIFNIKWLLITLAFLPCLLFSQELRNNVSLSDKIARFNESITVLNAPLAKKPLPLDELLAHAPVTAQNIDKEVATLDNSNKSQNEEKLIQVKEYIETLHQTIDDINQQYATLNTLNEGIEKLSDEAETLTQLLNNPISKNELSPNEQMQIPQLIADSKQLVTKHKTQREQLKQDGDLLKQQLRLSEQWQDALTDSLYASRPQQNETTEKQLQKRQHEFSLKADTLQSKLDKERAYVSNADIMAAQVHIYEAQNQAWLAKNESQLSTIMNSVRPRGISDRFSTQQLETYLRTTNDNKLQLNAIQSQLTERNAMLNKYHALTESFSNLMTQISDMQKIVGYQLIKQEILHKKISILLLEKKQQNLFNRQAWLNASTWNAGKEKAVEAAVQISYQIKISAQDFWQKMGEKPLFILLSALFTLVTMFVSLKLVSRLQIEKVQLSDYSRWFIATFERILNTLGVLRYLMASTIFIMLLLYTLDLSELSDGIINLLAQCFIASAIGLVLLGRESSINTLSPRLIAQGYAWFIVLIIGILAYGLSRLSLVDNTIQVLSEKSLMIVLIGFSVTLYRMARFYARTEKVDDEARFYDSYRKILIAIPLLTAATGALSLLGYTMLAWLVLKYLGIFSFVWGMLIIGLTLISHLRKQAKLQSLKLFKHGAFVAQDIVSPLSFIATLTWLYVMGLWLFSLANWNSNSYIITKILGIANHPIIGSGEITISGKMILLFCIALYFVYRVARWLKRFAYHWLFARIYDLGIRNSLSIFAQYLVALIGVLVALKFLGLDLTSLAVFAGALGVGVGLGLQDIAKNFISGILLLIERPLRTGDWVVLDDSEGVIKSIGLRAIILETFDKQDVIIPNGNAINNSFTNYTHSNKMTRTVLYVGASYDCAPKVVIDVLNKILLNIDAILSEPEPKIIMWEYADSCINYRIQYFIDLDKHSLFDTKTEILSKIWYEFDAHGIEIPFPQRDIHFRNVLPQNE